MKIQFLRFLRSLSGLFAGSAAAVAVYLATERLLGFYSDLDTDPTLELALPGFIVIFILSLPFGFAGHAILYPTKRRPIWAYCLVAALEAAAFFFITKIGDLSQFDLKEAMSLSLAAATCAAVAWLIRRPDRDNVALPKAIKTA